MWSEVCIAKHSFPDEDEYGYRDDHNYGYMGKALLGGIKSAQLPEQAFRFHFLERSSFINYYSLRELTPQKVSLFIEEIKSDCEVDYRARTNFIRLMQLIVWLYKNQSYQLPDNDFFLNLKNPAELVKLEQSIDLETSYLLKEQGIDELEESHHDLQDRKNIERTLLAAGPKPLGIFNGVPSSSASSAFRSSSIPCRL